MSGSEGETLRACERTLGFGWDGDDAEQFTREHLRAWKRWLDSEERALSQDTLDVVHELPLIDTND